MKSKSFSSLKLACSARKRLEAKGVLARIEITIGRYILYWEENYESI